MIYILWTAANLEEAKRVSRNLLEKKLIACASIIPAVHSLFHWKGEIEEAVEVKIFLKSRPELFEGIEAEIRALCSYEVPEIVLLHPSKVSEPYLSWLTSEVPLP